MPDYLFFLLVGGLIMKYGLANFATTLLQIFQVPHKLCHYTYQDCNDFDVSFGGRGRRELSTHLKHIAMMEGNKLSEPNQIRFII